MYTYGNWLSHVWLITIPTTARTLWIKLDNKKYINGHQPFLLSCFLDNPCPPCCFSESSCSHTPLDGTKPLLFTGPGVQDHSGEVKGSFGVGKLRWVWPWEDAKGSNGEEHVPCVLSWRESAAVAELMLYL